MRGPSGLRWLTCLVIGLFLSSVAQAGAAADAPRPQAEQEPSADPVRIERLKTGEKGGQGYRLVYHVNVPVSVYWRFKTDFDNDFVTENTYIRYHRLVSLTDTVALTENRYTYGPDVLFRWQTTIVRGRRRLDFVLKNPEECQQRYHHGSITIESVGDGTRVTQLAFFDFWGASFWAHYPWRGGMRDVLTNTARWEQATAVQLADRYRDGAKGSHDDF